MEKQVALEILADDAENEKESEFEVVDLKIDEEFKNLIVPHSEQERAALEDSYIKEKRFRDGIVIWNGYIIDGHMRFEIAQSHWEEKSLQFVNMSNELKTKEEVKEWIIRNQCARRNLTPEAYKYYIGKLYNERKMSHGGDRSTCQSDGLTTSEKLAQEFFRSPRSVERAGELAEVVDRIAAECGQDDKNKIIRGEIKLPYSQLKKLSDSENIKDDFESFMVEKAKKKAAPKQKQEQEDNTTDEIKNQVKCPGCGHVFCPEDNISGE